MNKKVLCNHGFLLQSFVIYAAIFVLLVTASVRLAVMIMPPAYNLMHWCGYTNFYTAYDFMSREFACAPVDSAAWLQADIKGFIWRSGSITKAFLIKKGNLVYKEGNYEQGTWKNASTSFLAHDCKFVIAELVVKDGTVHQIFCSACIRSKPVYAWECRQVFYG